MKRLVLVLAVASVGLPGAAHAAACTPLDCAPSQFAVAGTGLLGYRASALGRVVVADLRTGAKRYELPGGYVDGHLLVHQDGRALEWWDLRSGRRVGRVVPPLGLRLAGASQDGLRAVGFRLVHGGSTVVIGGLDAARWRQVPLPQGEWGFDALRGNDLFLIRYLRAGGYQVQLVDLSTDSPATRVVKDPRESGTIWGFPYSRLSSGDGRYVFTLYLATNGAAMVHELDLAHATARCIDLPGTGSFNDALSWSMALSPDGRTLWAANVGYGRLVGIDVSSRRVVAAGHVDLPYWNVSNATRAAVAPDGRQLALTDGETVALLRLGDGALVRRDRVRAHAIGYSPAGVLRELR